MRRLVAYVYNAETDSDWPLYEEDGKLYGFPNSALDGTPKDEIALIRGYWLPEPEDGPEQAI